MCRKSIVQKYFGYYMAVIMLIFLCVFSSTAHATAHVKILEPRTGALWAPYVEWSLDNLSYSGNPFDLVASVTFTYVNELGTEPETRITEMFYAGGTTWKFRFTGTRTGTWIFKTTSNDGELDGHTGTVTINANPNPKIRGFLRSYGNKFVKQVGENGELEPFLFNVHQSSKADDIDVLALSKNATPSVAIDGVIDDVIYYGGTVVFPQSPRNRFFDINAEKWNEHTSNNPDLNTFAQLEQVITQVHSRGLHFHFWAWGDEERKETPIGVCEGSCEFAPDEDKGINGTPDKRLQRYIAARLGPLPGWTMGYGFDLTEWVTENQIGEWATYLHDHFGWQHMIWARDLSHVELDVLSYGGFGNYLYSDAIKRLDSDISRPHLYAERFLYKRRSFWDMDGSRQKRWQYAMAGGIGSWWGWYWDPPQELPTPAQMRTHRTFWEKHMRFAYVRDNELSNGFVLKSRSNEHFIVYKENTGVITLDMSNINGGLPVIAVDAKLEYQSIVVDTWGAGNQTWLAPYVSDWALAIGDFNLPTPSLLPSAPVESDLTGIAAN